MNDSRSLRHLNRWQLLVLIPWAGSVLSAIILTWSTPRFNLVFVLLILGIIAGNRMETNAAGINLIISPTWLIYSLMMALLGPSGAVLGALVINIGTRPNRRLVNRLWDAVMLATLGFLGGWSFYWLNHMTGGTQACSGAIGHHCTDYLGGSFLIFILGLTTNFTLVWLGNFVPQTNSNIIRWGMFWRSLPPFSASGVLMVMILAAWSRFGAILLLAVAVIGGSFFLIIRRMLIAEHLAAELNDLSSKLDAERLYRVLANNLPGIMVILLDPDLQVIAVEGEAIATENKDSLLHQRLTETTMLGRKTQAIAVENCQAALLGESRHFDVALGRQVLETTLVPVYDDVDNQVLGGVLAVIRDVTAKRKTEAQIVKQAHYDSLTGLPNRAYFFEQLTRAAAQQANYGSPAVVMMLDLDGFKLVNDRLGHEKGDELLKIIAQRLQATVRSEDVVARLAGDEFTVILQGPDAVTELDTIARRIVTVICEPVQLADHIVQVAVSIGAAVITDDDDEGTTALRHADIAMYQAKAVGGSHYFQFAPGMRLEQPIIDLEYDRLEENRACRRSPSVTASTKTAGEIHLSQHEQASEQIVASLAAEVLAAEAISPDPPTTTFSKTKGRQPGAIWLPLPVGQFAKHHDCSFSAGGSGHSAGK